MSAIVGRGGWLCLLASMLCDGLLLLAVFAQDMSSGITCYTAKGQLLKIDGFFETYALDVRSARRSDKPITFLAVAFTKLLIGLLAIFAAIGCLLQLLGGPR